MSKRTISNFAHQFTNVVKGRVPVRYLCTQMSIKSAFHEMIPEYFMEEIRGFYTNRC
jgi:hypothetical protein